MKKIILLTILSVAGFIILIAQTPQAFKYQAIARDEAGNVLSICNIGLRISIMENGADVKAEYVETHSIQSNIYGLIDLVIGEGDRMTGNFSDIKWGENRHHLKIEMDIDGGENYKEIGTSQLYAVPYALYAEEAGKMSENPGQSATNKSSEKNNSGLIKNSKESGDREEGAANSKLPATGNSFISATNGNLGVGTTSPSEKLEVNGNILTNGRVIAEMGMTFFGPDGNPRQIIINPDGSLSAKFFCGGYIKDIRDGQQYNIVEISHQCWMAENLNTGIQIDGSVGQGNNSLIEKYCYGEEEFNCNLFGGLYQWDEMMNWVANEGATGICPAGWHVPSDWEWKILEGSVDTDNGIGADEWDLTGWRGVDAGLNLKSVSGWYNTGNGNDTYGFTALPGGYFNHTSGVYYNLTENGYFWTSSKNGSSALFRSQLHDNDKHYREFILKVHALSLRCIKDFECGDSITDPRDGKRYGTVKIGDQCWMSQNINAGGRIDGIYDQSNNSTIEKYCYDNNENNCDTYGGLYQWDEAMQYDAAEGTKGICPPGGWHIPTDGEWKILEGMVDSQYGIGDSEWNQAGWNGFDVGKNLKSLNGWYGTGNGVDLYNFKALPSGYRTAGGDFSNRNYWGYFWTTTDQDENNAYHHRLYYNNDDIWHGTMDKMLGISLRCIKE